MTLDHFEQSLLTDLRQHVAERSTTSSRTRRRWRWAAVPVGAAAAAVAAVMLTQTSAAYAVTESKGDVVVTITRLDDASGLQKALAAHGITADVDYTPSAAAPPAGSGGTHTERGQSGAGPTDTGPSQQSDGAADPGARMPDIKASLHGDTLTLRIDPDTIPSGDVLHITTGGSASSGASSLQVDFTHDR